MTPTEPSGEGSDSVRARQRVSGTSTTLHVLHIEDNPADALLMQEYIRDSNRQRSQSLAPGSTSAGPSAYSTVEFDLVGRLVDVTPARAATADCAILDLSLPDASDLEALIALRSMSDSLPIIVLTGFDDLETGLSALRHGADDYLVKSQVDGFTLDRAVRYALARRRLVNDVATAAEAATVDTAAVIVSAALQAEHQRAADGVTAAHEGARPAPDVLLGTHRVMVQIDGADGEYAVRCQSCGWEADRGAEDQHSWADRSLDWVLLRHVAFGDLPAPASAKAPPKMRASDIASSAEAARRRDTVRGAATPALPPVQTLESVREELHQA